MARYIQAFVQHGYDDLVLPSVIDDRGPPAALGVGVPLLLDGSAASRSRKAGTPSPASASETP